MEMQQLVDSASVLDMYKRASRFIIECPYSGDEGGLIQVAFGLCAKLPEADGFSCAQTK